MARKRRSNKKNSMGMVSVIVLGSLAVATGGMVLGMYVQKRRAAKQIAA